MADVPLVVISEFAQSERRITPSWSISQLKGKLETVTGVPPSCQRLSLKPTAGAEAIAIEAPNEDDTHLSNFPLAPYAELHVPRSMLFTGAELAPEKCGEGGRAGEAVGVELLRMINLNDTAGVDKYVMPEEEYEKKTDSVLAWKKAQKLGRFDPDAPSHEETKLQALDREVATRGIAVGRRCRVGGEDTRRGVIQYVGEVKEIPGGLGSWVGVQLDEPVGKNDGSIAGTRYWGEPSELKHGVFVRPERVEVGDFPALDDLEDMEEI
ncbi:tubulin specific chaperone cofactor B [Fusarium phyllophilum]|uniref:Tubulin specific chaperone cofactor B n=1 Tax=Fusarium phyllophilum TaxID=47803 RepID=A0A8H5IEZ6_9HYPO|nr:tubulin specific chaperone cofactor B [Fusarium phyllophilum]